MNYILRPTSLSGVKLDIELRRYGAHTSGSTLRKQERLRRFIAATEASREKLNTLRSVVEREQRKVQERAEARAAFYRRN
jgi:hypothetical protein